MAEDATQIAPGVQDWSPVQEPIANPIGNPIGNPIANPIGNPIANPIANPIGNPIGNPIANPIANTGMQPVLFDSTYANGASDQKFTVGTFAMTRFGTTKFKSATKPPRRPSPPNNWPSALVPQQDMFTSFNPMGSGQASPFGNQNGAGVYHAQFSPPISQLPSPMPSPEPSLYTAPPPPMMQSYPAAQLGY